MYGVDFEREIAHERMSQAHRKAEERRLAKLVGERTPTVRARVARRLFEMSVRVERDAAFRAVWDEMGNSRNVERMTPAGRG